MAKHTVHYWMIGRPEEAADAAYDNGFTEGSWVLKGGMMFFQTTREGESEEAVANAVAHDLHKHNVPFDERTLNLSDPTDFLEEHPGWYDDEELAEIVARLTKSGDEPDRLVILKRNLDNGNK